MTCDGWLAAGPRTGYSKAVWRPGRNPPRPRLRAAGVLRHPRRASWFTGREPLSALDAAIRDWRSRGGDQIRKEFEQALKEQ